MRKPYVSESGPIWTGKHIPRCLIWIGKYIRKQHEIPDNFKTHMVREVTENIYIFEFFNPATLKEKWAYAHVKCEPQLTIEHQVFDTEKETEKAIEEKFGIHAGVEIPPEAEIWTEEEVETPEEKKRVS